MDEAGAALNEIDAMRKKAKGKAKEKQKTVGKKTNPKKKSKAD